MSNLASRSGEEAAPTTKFETPPGIRVSETEEGRVGLVIGAGGGNPLRSSGGSATPAFNSFLVGEVVKLMPSAGGAPQTATTMCAITAALEGFKPVDEVEGMLAAQAVALHLVGMDTLRRSMIQGQPAELASRLRRDGANLLRGMADIAAALDRKRGVHQTMRIERVNIEAGAQAIVGHVGPGRGRD